MYDIGSDKQLFIDHRFIESSEQVRLVVNQPVKRAGAVLRADQARGTGLHWAGTASSSTTAPTRCGTTALSETASLGHLTGYVVPAGTARASLPVPGRYRLCYAESHDGLEWHKPDLGLIELDGSKRNNIVQEDFKLAYVFLDLYGPESERFKLIHWTGPGIAVTTSADGLNWDRPSRQVSMLAPTHRRWRGENLA